MAEIQITGDGRDPKGRRIFHCLCPDCGQPFSARADNVRKGKTKHCPACRGVDPKPSRKLPMPVVEAPPVIAEGEVTPPNPHEMMTPDWYRYEIASCETTLRVLLDQAGKLVRKIEEEGGVALPGMDGKSAAQLAAQRQRAPSIPQEFCDGR